MFETNSLTSTFNWPAYRTAEEVNSAMGRIYGYMMMAVVVSMAVAGFIGFNPALVSFFFTGVMKWIVMFLPLVAVMGISFALASDPPKPVALALLIGFAAIMGLSFAVIFAIFKLGSVFTAFMGTVVLFGVMSAYGYFTKKSLDSIGKYLIVALIAIIIASIINIFIGSSLFSMVISAVAILIFLGLTAYDTQRIREMIMENSSDAVEVQGALTLYMDFINIFLNLLQLFGEKKE